MTAIVLNLALAIPLAAFDVILSALLRAGSTISERDSDTVYLVKRPPFVRG